jgi:hypothetical protein
LAVAAAEESVASGSVSEALLTAGAAVTAAWGGLARRALAEGETELAWRLMEQPAFHRDVVPLRQNVHTMIQTVQDGVFTDWIRHSTGLRTG